MIGQDQQPLCYLYTSMLRKGDVEIERFSTATVPWQGSCEKQFNDEALCLCLRVARVARRAARHRGSRRIWY